MRNGSVEFFNLATSILATFVPAASLPNTGFAFKDYDAVWAAMDGGLGDYVRAEIAKTPILTVSKVWDNGFRQITSSTREIRTPRGPEGLQDPRAPGADADPRCSRRSMPARRDQFNELYSALQTKVVEGQENPLAITATARLYEVQKSCSLTGHVWDGYWILGNKKAWQAPAGGPAPDGFQRARPSGTDQRADVAKLSLSLRESLTAKGISFVDVRPLRASARPWAGRASTGTGRQVRRCGVVASRRRIRKTH